MTNKIMIVQTECSLTTEFVLTEFDCIRFEVSDSNDKVSWQEES